MVMTITQLIDSLRGIYAEHGDVEVLDGRRYSFHAHNINVVTVDDWENARTEKGSDGADYEIPAIGYAVAIGSKF